MYTPGWYPDPLHRHEHRYHNGTSWTADVASQGQRFVDPLGVRPSAVAPSSAPTGSAHAGAPRPSNGLAVAALSCGIVSIAIGWIPVVFAVGAVLAVLAVVFGTIAMRRSRHIGRGRGFAVAGLVTGSVGVLVAVGGLWFTIAVYRALDRYENPAAHSAPSPECSGDDGRVDGTGEIQNLASSSADFTVVIELSRQASGIPLSTVRVRIDDVQPGEIRTYQFGRRVGVDGVTCSVASVKGPLPFGVVVDRD